MLVPEWRRKKVNIIAHVEKHYKSGYSGRMRTIPGGTGRARGGNAGLEQIGMRSFVALDSRERTVAILGDRCWPQPAR